MTAKKIISLMTAFSMTAALASPIAVSADQTLTVRLKPTQASKFNNGEFQGWGTSLCWWANRIGYSESLTSQAAEAFFSDDGLGLDIARYNIGGGDDPEHNHITRSDSKVPGVWSSFEISEDGSDVQSITYDVTKDANQLNVAKAAKEANADIYFEGFSNSAPYFMTESGCSSGAENASDDNLKTEMYDDFAEYIADATLLLKEEGIEFGSYSPMNEPDTSYWGALSPKQEGCHFTPGTNQSNMIIQTRDALDNKGLSDVLVAGMDETSIDTSVTNLDKLTDEAKQKLGRIDTHTYDGSQRSALKNKALEMNKNLWMSEVDGGWDGFGLAERIITDMNGMQPSAWIMWDIVDIHKDSTFENPVTGEKDEANNSVSDTSALWGVAMADHDNEELVLTNKYYAFGQFSRYINPGDTIIASSSDSLAAYNKESGDIKVVALNSDDSAKECVIDFSAFVSAGSEFEEIRTSDEGEKWAVITDETEISAGKLTTSLAARSITTYVIKGSGETDYAVITPEKSRIALGSSVSYALDTNLSGDVSWTSSDTDVAEIAADGTLTALKSGSVVIIASVNGVSVEKEITVTDCIVTGTQSWSNTSNAPSDSSDYLKAVDGDLSTYFDGNSGGYVCRDYQTPVKITDLKLAPRSGFAERSVGGTVQGSNDGISWTDIYEVTSALAEGEYTQIDQSEFLTDKAYRYYRYTNDDNMTNIAEFLTECEIFSDTTEDEPSIYDVPELTDDFEDECNIFDAEEGNLDSDENMVFASGLSRFSNVFVPIKSTATAELDEPIELSTAQKFRLTFNMFAGWESSGKSNSLVLKDANGNEVVAILITGGGYTLEEVRIGGSNVLASTAMAQCRSNWTGSKTGANGWNVNGQQYNNNVGYNKYVSIMISGSGAVSVELSGGMEETSVTGTVSDPEIASLTLSGDYNSARNRVVSYDNFDADVITYTEPEATLEPTAAPVVPDSGELINLSFDNADLTSSSEYGKASGTPDFVSEDGRECAYFDGTADSVVTLTDANGNSLLSGQEEFTVSFKVKPVSAATSWWFYAAPNRDTQTYLKEKYIGVMSNGGTVIAERYNNNGSRPAAAATEYNADEWNDVMIIMSDDATKVYVNGVKSEQASEVDISELLGTQSIALIGCANWGTGEYATGYIDDFVIKNKAVTIPEITVGDWTEVTSDIYLPPEASDGSTISWSTSNAAVVTSYGKVTRPDNTTTVSLTASVTNDDGTFTTTYPVTVMGLARAVDTFTAYAEDGNIKYTNGYIEDDTPYDVYVAMYNSDGTLAAMAKNTAQGEFSAADDEIYKVSCYVWGDMTPKACAEKYVRNTQKPDTSAYMFVHFVNTEGDANCEQIYFSVSQDGQTWTTLNNSSPVLTSTVGEEGVRDPYIIRGEDGKFFIIATDLSIYNRRSDSNRWSTCQTSGSKSIVIWESEDLVNWSEARLVEVADANAGCTWAPEACYDPEKDMYMVFWASKVSDDNYSLQRVYRSYTADFVTFTEPEIYIEGNVSNIDTTITEEKGVYYRFTKNESKSTVIMEKSRSLSGDWSAVSTYNLSDMTGYEGPAIYKLNGEDKWCLLLDYYSKSQGYKPFVTEDLSVGEFTRAADFEFDGTYRHGTVLPITAQEYELLVDTYGE